LVCSFSAKAENLAEQLKSLNELYKSGSITEQEFKSKKTKLIKGEKIKIIKNDIEGLLFILEESISYEIKIDYDVAAKQYGFKNFKDFVKKYSELYEIPNLTVKEAKEFLKATDTSIKIVESQENLDKLYSLIMNDKTFLKYQKKKDSYTKLNKSNKALAVYINYEKEIAKITENPNLKKISRFAWDYGWGSGAWQRDSNALAYCKKDAAKYKAFGGECIIVDINGQNALKPRLKLGKEETQTQQVSKVKPKGFKPVTVVDHVEMLGTFINPSRYPEGMIKTKIFKSCKDINFFCASQKATKEMAKIFRRGDQYHQRHPGEMLYAMAYFEIFYLKKLREKKKRIEQFLDGWPDKKRGGKSIISLLKLNKARKKMRAALGMTMDMSVEEVMERYWILGDFLEQGEIKKQKVHKDVKKRKALLAKYKSRVNRFNSKIESEEDEKLYEQIYKPKFKKFKWYKMKRKNS